LPLQEVHKRIFQLLLLLGSAALVGFLYARCSIEVPG